MQRKNGQEPGLTLAYRTIAVLATVGLGTASYLTFLHFSETSTSFCIIGSDCDIVRHSKYSQVLGVPVALIGALGYIGILALALIPLKSNTKVLALFVLSLVGFAYSAYLTYLEVFSLGALCSWCLISFAAISLIFLVGLALMSRFRNLLTGKSRPGLMMGIIALVSVVALAACSGGEADPSTDYKAEFAQYLGEIGAVMYGTYWCPACQNQKDKFGDAFKFIEYVECDPKGKDAKPSLCQSKGIKAYPTWEINGRFYEGAMPLDTLSRLSGFREP